MEVRELRISWAITAAISPVAESFSVRIICSCSRLRSVMSVIISKMDSICPLRLIGTATCSRKRSLACVPPERDGEGLPDFAHVGEVEFLESDLALDKEGGSKTRIKISDFSVKDVGGNFYAFADLKGVAEVEMNWEVTSPGLKGNLDARSSAIMKLGMSHD